MNKRIMMLFVLSIFLLGGCVSTLDSMLSDSSPKDVLRKVEEAHNEIQSVEVSFTENMQEYTDTGHIIIDVANNESFITLEEDDLSIYINEDDLLVEYVDGEVESWADTGILADLENRVEFEKNPIAHYKELDENIFDKFELSKEDDRYILQFEGNEADSESLSKALTYYEAGLEDFDESVDFLDMEIISFSLTLMVDSSTYLLEKIEQDLTYKFEEDSDETVAEITHQYSNYNDAGEITPLEATVEDGEGLNKSSNGGASSGDLSDEEKELYEEEAAAYLDALIQATVFQNAEGFVEKAPDSMTKEDKEAEAEIQRDFFKEMYSQNTKTNMEGLGVSDEEISDLTDAFLEALSITKYEIVGAEAISSEDIVVTVSIEGLDDAKIYEETDEQLYDEFMENEMTEDELVSKNMELLTENYKKEDAVLNAVEVEVDVTREGEGSYLVMLQDQYLVGGFVQ